MLIKLYMKKTVKEPAGAASNKFPFASVGDEAGGKRLVAVVDDSTRTNPLTVATNDFPNTSFAEATKYKKHSY